MELVNITKGQTLPDGRIEVSSRSVSRPSRYIVAANKADEFIAQQHEYGVENVLKGKMLKNGNIEIFITPKAPESQKYAVPSDKTDEFIAEYKKSTKKNFAIIAGSTLGLTTIGVYCLSRLMKNTTKWLKIPTLIAGTLIGAGVSLALSLNLIGSRLVNQEKNMLNKYGAERIK